MKSTDYVEISLILLFPEVVHLIKGYTKSPLRIHKLCFFTGWFLSKVFLSASPFPKVVLVFHNNLVDSTFAQNAGGTNLMPPFSKVGLNPCLLSSGRIPHIVSGIWLLLWKTLIWTKKVEVSLTCKRKLEEIQFLLQHSPGKAMQNPSSSVRQWNLH